MTLTQSSMARGDPPPLKSKIPHGQQHMLHKKGCLQIFLLQFQNQSSVPIKTFQSVFCEKTLRLNKQFYIFCHRSEQPHIQ